VFSPTLVAHMSSDISVTRTIVQPASVESARERPPPPVQPFPADRSPEKLAPLAPPNPSLRLDPELEIVVLEFRDEAGQVRNTIPTEQQLAAYRAWDRTQSGEPPRGRYNNVDVDRAPPPVAGATGTAEPAPQTARPVAATGGSSDSRLDSTDRPPVNGSATDAG